MITSLRGELACLDGTTPYNFTGATHTRVAQALIGALIERSSGLKLVTAIRHRSSLAKFLEFLDSGDVDPESGFQGLPHGLLDSFERDLRADYAGSTASGVASAVKRYVRDIAEMGIADVPELVLEEALGLDGRYDPGDPFQPYPSDQLNAIRRACVLRLRAALSLLRSGDSVAEEGDGVIADAVRRMRANGPRSQKAYVERVDARLSPALKSAGVPWEKVLQMVGPTSTIGEAVACLLVLGSGMEAGQPYVLRSEAIQDLGGGTARLEYEKSRANSVQEDVFRSSGITGLLGLKNAYLKLTRFIRPFARDEDQGTLLLVVRHTSTQSGQVRPIAYTRRGRQGGLNRLVREYDLVDREGEPLRIQYSRVRKNFWEASYRRNPFSVRSATRSRKTLDIASEHYFKVKGLRILHEDAIRKGIESAFAVQDQSEPDLSDSFVAKCRDPLRSPYAPEGTLCSDPLLGCFFCGNAVFTKSNLPAVLSLAAEAARQRQMLPEAEWAMKWGGILEQIEEGILPRFSAEVVDEARSQFEDDVDELFLSYRVLNVKAR